MKLALIYLVTFLAGPVMFWLLARQPASQRYMLALFGLLALLIAAAFALNFWVLPAAPNPSLAGLAIIATLWMGWVVVLALCALTVRRRSTNTTLHRMAFALSAMATTLPWFGLYAAQMIGD